MKKESFVIVTPAFNEAGYIAGTIESVLAQSVLPTLWVIVDDGSTDNTAEIVKRYAGEYDWIRYVYRDRSAKDSYYTSNVYAIMEGLEEIRNCKSEIANYCFLAILDADIPLPSDYYEKILNCFQQDQSLGIASGVYQDNLGNGRYRKVLNDRRSTPKGLMVFSRQCYDDIGGLVPMPHGGEDTVACFAARMHGWKSWSFPQLLATHNKPVGTGHSASLLKIRFRQGVGEYFLASHPLFMLMKSLRRCIKEPPYVIGGLLRLTGYIYGFFIREQRQLPDELIKYIHKDQLDRVFKCNRVPEDLKPDLLEEHHSKPLEVK